MHAAKGSWKVRKHIVFRREVKHIKHHIDAKKKKTAATLYGLKKLGDNFLPEWSWVVFFFFF